MIKVLYDGYVYAADPVNPKTVIINGERVRRADVVEVPDDNGAISLTGWRSLMPTWPVRQQLATLPHDPATLADMLDHGGPELLAWALRIRPALALLLLQRIATAAAQHWEREQQASGSAHGGPFDLLLAVAHGEGVEAELARCENIGNARRVAARATMLRPGADIEAAQRGMLAGWSARLACLYAGAWLYHRDQPAGYEMSISNKLICALRLIEQYDVLPADTITVWSRQTVVDGGGK